MRANTEDVDCKGTVVSGVIKKRFFFEKNPSADPQRKEGGPVN